MLAEVVNDSLKIEGEEKEQAYRARPSSSDPERCLRQMDYHRQNYTKHGMSSRAYGVFEDGNDQEANSIKRINKTSYRHHSNQFTMNIPVKGINLEGYMCPQCEESYKSDGSVAEGKDSSRWVPPEHMHTHIDGIITDLMGTEYLFEHKAISCFAFQKWWDSGLPLSFFTQTAWGLRGLLLEGYGINRATILIKNKNTSAFVEYLVYYDLDLDTMVVYEKANSNKEVEILNVVLPRITELCTNRFLEIEKFAVEGKLHERDYVIGESWRCDYCQWNQICWTEIEKDFEKRLQTSEIIDDDFNQDLILYDTYRAQEKKFKLLKEEIKIPIVRGLEKLNTKKGFTRDFTVSVNIKKKKEGLSETLHLTARKVV